VSFALLAGVAITLAVLSVLIAQFLEWRMAAPGLVLLIFGDVAVFLLFGLYLLDKLVLRPMRDLVEVTEELAGGNLAARAAPAATAELAHLAERFNAMTERLDAAYAELVRTEKLASIGRLAAGIAHEVGNPLAAIGTYLEVQRRQGADPELVGAIAREADRIDRIVRSLLAYSRPHQDDFGDVDVAGVVRSVVELLTHQGAFVRTRLAHDLPPHLPTVRGTVHGLEQALVNLLLNAVDAAPDGVVSVGAVAQAFRVEAPGESRRDDTERPPPTERAGWRRPHRPEIAEGTSGVLIWVADSGRGIAPPDRDRVFEPFFTTKHPGLGTGLGLAIVQGSVHEMGGLVWVEDAREGGAAFKIFLPASPPSPAARAATGVGG
jgi:two-component system NtrC family sensor kinase